jgi:hypothetical protein
LIKVQYLVCRVAIGVHWMNKNMLGEDK